MATEDRARDTCADSDIIRQEHTNQSIKADEGTNPAGSKQRPVSTDVEEKSFKFNVKKKKEALNQLTLSKV